MLTAAKDESVPLVAASLFSGNSGIKRRGDAGRKPSILTDALTSETYPSGRVVTTNYDATNRVSSVTGTFNGSTPTYANNLAYSPHGAATQLAYGNNLWRAASYNSLLQMSGFVDALNNWDGNEFLNVSLSWYANGNLNVATLKNGGAAANNGGIGYPQFLAFTQTFTYDTVNRLLTATDTGGWSRNYYYDAYGNMAESGSGVPFDLNAPVTATSSVAGFYNANNQLTVTGMGYNPAGYLSKLSGFSSFTYDGEGRQTSAGRTGGLSVTYQYDGDGRRVEKVVGGSPRTVFVYDALGRMAAEYSSSAETPACITCYLSPDHLGTPRMVTDQNANVVARHDYLPLGEEVPVNTAGRNSQWGAGNDAINQKFTSKERDSESGLDYFGARYYGSALGRFTTPDDFNDSGITDPSSGKVSFNPGPLPYADVENPQSLNKYAYVQNNPLRYTDPNGHCVEDACILEGAAVGTGVLYGGSALAGAVGLTGVALVLHNSGDAIISGAKSLLGSIVSLITQASNSNSNPQNAPPASADTATTPTTAPAVPGTATAGQPRSLPLTGEPGTTSTLPKADGSPKQVRRYGPDGTAQTDVDHTTHHGSPNPHAHDWSPDANGKPQRGAPRNVRPDDPKPNT